MRLATERKSMPQSTAIFKQPNSHHCFVCGIKNPYGLNLQFYDDGKGEVTSTYTVSERYQGYPGTVHGGIVASMLDEVVGRTLMIGDPDHFGVSAKLTVRYRKPIPLNTPLQLVGRIIRRRGRSVVAKAELRLPDESIGAEAEAIIIDAPGFLVDEETLDRLGWKVQPDNEVSQGSEK
jgi:acyl-coenzyme A thioesterase PaaI-like protein